jgi:hypothetical protein
VGDERRIFDVSGRTGGEEGTSAGRATLMGRLLLVRHGESEGNASRRFTESDLVPLTPAGREQAERTAAFLRERFAAVRIVSPVRARDRRPRSSRPRWHCRSRSSPRCASSSSARCTVSRTTPRWQRPASSRSRAGSGGRPAVKLW